MGSKTQSHVEALRKALSDPETVEKRSMTMIERYGAATPFALDKNRPTSVRYWLERGRALEDAKEAVRVHQVSASAMRKTVSSHWTRGYWMERGLGEREAVLKISEIQAKNGSSSAISISQSCIKFLNSVEATIGKKLLREHQIGPFVVDGFEPEAGVVIEYFGSFWHMNPKAFQSTDVNRVTGRMASSQWAEDAGRVSMLERMGYKVIVAWEFEEQTALNEVMHAFAG